MWGVCRPITAGIRGASTVSRAAKRLTDPDSNSPVAILANLEVSVPGLSDPTTTGKISDPPPAPPLKDYVKVRYPPMTFSGHIVYGRTFYEVEKAASEILDTIEAQEQCMDKIYVGFDLEWKPTFIRGQSPGKAAVMQICVDPDHCYVMHIFHSGIPPALREILENRAFIKVGVCIANDARKVFRDYDIQVHDLEDLSRLANAKFGGSPRMWSLGSLTEKLICKQLEKLNLTRLSNWEATVLSREQLNYAATDAFASWLVHQVLRSFPVVTEVDRIVTELDRVFFPMF